MAHDQALGKRIWEGDESAIAEARKRFVEDSSGQLLSWASTLYSFRRYPDRASELLKLSEQLMMRAYEFRLRQGIDYLSHKKLADEADVLATILEWISRKKLLSRREVSIFRDQVLLLCENGKKHLERYGITDHTWCLLELTRARVFLEQGQPKMARNSLQAVEECLATIDDSRQKARVLRKLGFLYWKSWILGRWLKFGVTALFVPNVPLDVRKKSLAALVGIDI